MDPEMLAKPILAPFQTKQGADQLEFNDQVDKAGPVQKQWISGGLQQQAVELQIHLENRPNGGLSAGKEGLCFLAVLGEGIERGSQASGKELPQGKNFRHFPELPQMPDVGIIERDHRPSISVLFLKHPERLELQQCLPHHARGNPEFPGQRQLRDSLPGRPPTFR